MAADKASPVIDAVIEYRCHCNTAPLPLLSASPFLPLLSASYPLSSVVPHLKGLKDYKYLAVLGRGHFGKVLMAEDLEKKELVAIKVRVPRV